MKIFVCALASAISLLSHAMADGGTHLIASASNDFGNKLYKNVAAGGGNTVICPVSLHIALSLLKEGASGKSKQELQDVLRVTNAKESYKALLGSLKGQDTLKIATKLFPADNFNLNPEFVSIAENYYESEVQNLNFGNPAVAASTINKYVEDKTNNKIHDLVKQDSLSDLTKMVMINAVYFNAKWASVFPHGYQSDFHVSETERVPVKFMSQTGQFAYKDDAYLNAKVLKMDYTEGGYSMILVLPNTKFGLADVEGKMEGRKLPDLLENLKEHRVEVVIPKFQIEQTHNLKEILSTMGIKDIFSSRADLRKLATGENLYVSDVIQKTFIKVHENGTEAAAATAGYVELLSAPSSDERSFYAKRPFFFSLVNEISMSVLFQGRLIRPESESESEAESEAVVYPKDSEEKRPFERNPEELNPELPRRPPTSFNVPSNQNNLSRPQTHGVQNSGVSHSHTRPTVSQNQDGARRPPNPYNNQRNNQPQNNNPVNPEGNRDSWNNQNTQKPQNNVEGIQNSWPNLNTRRAQNNVDSLTNQNTRRPQNNAEGIQNSWNNQKTQRPQTKDSWTQTEDRARPNSPDYPNDEPQYGGSEVSIDRSAPAERNILYVYYQGRPIPLSNFRQIIQG